MNPFLAELYNTAENIGLEKEASEDVEKLAQIQVMDEMLSAEGIDVDELSGDSILKVAEALFGPDNEISKIAEEDGCPDCGKVDCECPAAEKEAQAKIAEADFLGRVMAHSYIDEMSGMDKEALSARGAYVKAKKGLGQGAEWLGGKLTPKGISAGAGEVAAKGRRQKILATMKNKGVGGHKWSPQELQGLMRDSGEAGQKFRRVLSRGGEVASAKAKKKLHRGVGYAAGGVGALGAAGGTAAALSGGKDKKSSAIDFLAEKRAYEWLEDQGFGYETEEEKLASAVEERAYDMLVEAGYIEE